MKAAKEGYQRRNVHLPHLQPEAAERLRKLSPRAAAVWPPQSRNQK
jgi:hypothetical protein